MTDKLANLEKAIRELQDLYDDPDIVIPASQLPEKENPYKDFMDRNPMAGGGMLVQPSADGSRPGYAKDKKKINRDESYRKVVKDFVATSGPGTGQIFDDPAAIDIVKANLNRIKSKY
jgi:hypothetical protein